MTWPPGFGLSHQRSQTSYSRNLLCFQNKWGENTSWVLTRSSYLLPRWMQFPLSSEAALWAERPPIQHERPWTPKCSKGCLFCTPGSPKPLLSPTPPRPISTERTLAECSLKADLSLFKHFRAFYWWKSRVRSEGSRVCLRVDNLASLGEGVHENLASVAVYLKAPRRDSVRSAYKWLKFLKGY